MKVALIDGDAIYYVLGWQMRERIVEVPGPGMMMPGLPEDAIPEMYGAVDQFIIGILQAVGATHYLGAIGDKTKCFRYQVAKFKPYKAQRKEPDAWFRLWKPVIEHRLREEWDFVSVPELEADDIIALAHELYYDSRAPIDVPDGEDITTVVVCSPDKDLRQLPGQHFDYKKVDFAEVSQEDADYNLAFLMIAGDSSDGVAGIPGAGEKKAKEKLKEGKGNGQFPDQVVRSMYYKHFGDHYGQIIYRENDAVLRLVTSQHPFYEVFTGYADKLQLRAVPEGLLQDQPTTDKLKALGWG